METGSQQICTLSLHDALPILSVSTLEALAQEAVHKHNRPWVLTLLDARMDEVYAALYQIQDGEPHLCVAERVCAPEDRKSTRLNSSHVRISYAVFCLKKKKPH